MPDIEVEKEDIKNVPAWIRLNGLPLKFWGNSLPKIANLVGTYVKFDTPTEQKIRLGFARLMVELKLGQTFPEKIKFLDEKKQKNQQPTIKPVKTITTPENKQQHISITEAEEVITPITRPLQLHSGTMSPARLTKAIRQRVDDMSKNIYLSPTYMEVLNGQGSSKESVYDGVYGLIETKIKANKVNKTMNNILDKVAKVHFHYTIVYAFNGVSEREPLWSNLRRLAGAIHGPWAVGGDFNCVLFDHVRLGGKVSHAEADPFHDCLDSCHLINNQALGAYYT
ncbi:uncharacterized protein LOC141632456 [Silene latifolia]|uniref:uncharacterized protein LOC141632456 n=1 Tax=Silene latifolia TaxID=37657 RepID=UPI003D7849C9